MMRRTLSIAALAAAFLTAPSNAQDVLLKNAKVYTLDRSGTIEGGDVWLRGETIAGVGKTIQGSSGSQVIDAAGLWVTPGIINAYTRLGAIEVDAVYQSRDDGASGAPFSAGYDVSYGINPASTLMAVTRMEGITRAASVPAAQASLFAGYGALIDLGMDQDAVFKPKAFMSVALGERGSRLAGGGRGAAHVMLRQALDEASGKAGSDRFDNLLARIDVDALKPVVRGDIPLFVEVERAADIRNVIALKRSYRRLKIVLVGANEGWMVADEIAAAGIPVITDASLNLPDRFEILGATLANAARLRKAGVTIAIATGPNGSNEAHNARLLLQLGGIAVSYGLAWEDALAAVTINPAKILGVESVLGSLSPGKRGDVVVWNGDPFELTTRPVAVYIDGQAVPLESRQTKLRDRYLDLSSPVPFPYKR